MACCLNCPPVPPILFLYSLQALDPAELKSEGLALSLEEQLSAMTLSELCDTEPSPIISLNGEQFKAELFENTRVSSKVLLSPLFW